MLSRTTSVQEVSKVLQGLHALDRAGEIRLSLAATTIETEPRVLRLQIRGPQVEPREIAIDLADQRQSFSMPNLEQVAIYFKRSLCSDSMDALPPQLRSRVRPFGMNNPSMSIGAARRVLGARARSGRRPRELATDLRQLLALPSPMAFEALPDGPAEASILFQTQVWPASPSEQDRISVNEERVRLVRLLRKQFGRRFRGGIVPTAFAKRHYPDALTELPCSMRAYPRVVKQALVCVYTRGLHDSLAFKMSEYLAASRCIVAQRPHQILPETLTDGGNFLGFESDEQCVARCEQLLQNPALAREMRRENWDYYRRQVEPRAHLARIVDEA